MVLCVWGGGRRRIIGAYIGHMRGFRQVHGGDSYFRGGFIHTSRKRNRPQPLLPSRVVVSDTGAIK